VTAAAADDHHGLPTPRSTLRDSSACVLVWCKSCRHQADADLQHLVDTGRGDVPLIHLRYRCSKCRSRLTDFVCTSRYGGRPGWNRDGSA
jgi:hypothetical protein